MRRRDFISGSGARWHGRLRRAHQGDRVRSGDRAVDRAYRFPEPLASGGCGFCGGELHVRSRCEAHSMSGAGQSATPTFATGMEEVASIADAGWHGTRFAAETTGHARRSQQAAARVDRGHLRLGPCVDGSGLARVFFTQAAVVGAAMCSAC
jgi:hypothetical protein